MQTILGAGGQIAVELAKELRRNYTGDIRLVSRRPSKVHEADQVATADLLDAEQTMAAVAGSDTVYFTAGLPLNTAQWEQQFVPMLRGAIAASKAADARFVYFDNTYMYPQDDRLQTEATAFEPSGRKGKVRADMAMLVLEEMERGDIPVLLARAPEFYGPARTQGFTNSLVIDRLRNKEKPRVPVRDDKLRTLIWTPDASRALALLANEPEAYEQTWHLPVDPNRLTYREFVTAGSQEFGWEGGYRVLPEWELRAGGAASPRVREMWELLPRYRHDNLFDSSKFAERFPEFPVTTYREGLRALHREATGGPDPL